jgi:ribosomal protein S15P/S13E
MTPEEQSIHLVGRLAKLERELQETRSDLEFRRGLYRLQAERVERLERELEQERQDRKQAELEVFRVRRDRNDARAIISATLKALPVGYIPAHTAESLPGRVADLVGELGRLTAMIEDASEVELAMIRGDIAIPDREEFDAIRTPSGYNPSPIGAEIDAHLDECLARSERDWKPLPGDPDVFYPRP